MKRDKPRLVLIVSFDKGDVNEIPVDDRTIISVSNGNGPISTFALAGVKNLVLTEAMDFLDNTFALAPGVETA